MAYTLFKMLHILSACLIISLWMLSCIDTYFSHQNKDRSTCLESLERLFNYNWYGIIPLSIWQILSGFMIIAIEHYSYQLLWLKGTLMGIATLFFIYASILYLQHRAKMVLLNTDATSNTIPRVYHRLLRWRIVLGMLAFIVLCVMIYFMANRTGLYT